MKAKLSALGFSLILAACGGGGSSSSDANTTVPPPLPALPAAKAFLESQSALFATAVPATGAAYFVNSDGCTLRNGRSKAYVVAEFDSEPKSVASSARLVGSKLGDLRVMAERSSTNADGTMRREIDVEYVVHYKDGTQSEIDKETLISGSSYGSTMADGTICTTPENRVGFRFYGNRKLVHTYVTAVNSRAERTTLATGLPVSPQVVYSKFITLGVQDPAGVATYAIVSGPGIYDTSPLTPTSLKLVSARLLRDDPLFAGKNGNNVNLENSDNFRICRADNGRYAQAETADCTANGATSSALGVHNYAVSSVAAGDAVFAAAQIVAGGVYTIKVYNDDGWKTVNGQVGKTPIATYTSTLRHLPFNLVDMAGSSEVTDLFPRLTSNSRTPAQMAADINNKTAFTTNLTWSLPGLMPDARATGLVNVFAFAAGKKNAAQANNYPVGTLYDPIFPTSGATAASLNFAAPGGKFEVPTFGEIGLTYSNRNGNVIQSTYTFQ